MRICPPCLSRASPALWHQDSPPGAAAHLRLPLEHPWSAKAGIRSSEHTWADGVCDLGHTRRGVLEKLAGWREESVSDASVFYLPGPPP